MLSDIQGSFISAPSVSMFPLDIKETSDSYELLCDIPGVKKEDVKIEIENHILTITTEKKKEVKEESDKILRTERFEGTMSRSIKLPENADEENVTARFEDGVLKLRVKKREAEVLKAKQITIE
jgi:HSP20 family protein